MRKLSMAAIALVASLNAVHASNMSDESHLALKAVARWSMCLLETQDETTTKAQVYSVIQEVDRKFQSHYGIKATTLAQNQLGPDWVQVYFEDARQHHATLPVNHADMCTSLGRRVVSLTR